MKKKILVGLLAIVSMLMIVAVSWMPSASADMEGTKTINEDEYWIIKSSFFSGDYLTLSYTIDVQNDQWIDVVLLNEENYNKYTNGQSFSANAEGTDLNTLYKKVSSITFYEHDNYYLVVDNTDGPPGGAQPAWDGINNYCTFHYVSSAQVHSNPSGGGSSTTWEDEDDDLAFLCGIAIIGIIIIVVVILMVALVRFIKKQRQQTQPHYPPQQPPQPYYRGQQPPPPPPDYRPPQ